MTRKPITVDEVTKFQVRLDSRTFDDDIWDDLWGDVVAWYRDPRCVHDGCLICTDDWLWR